MSHFTVAVFTYRKPDDELLNEILEPFNECTENPAYLEFEPDEEGDFQPEYDAKGWMLNPNARWDWWQVGGRWEDELKLTDGTRCNSAPVRHCTFTPDPGEIANAEAFWDGYVEGGDPDMDDFWKPEYYRKQYGTKEEYVRLTTDHSPFAYLTNDGEWVETGRTGWFGVSDATAESRNRYATSFAEYLEYARDNDLWITIVDCHI